MWANFSQANSSLYIIFTQLTHGDPLLPIAICPSPSLLLPLHPVLYPLYRLVMSNQQKKRQEKRKKEMEWSKWIYEEQTIKPKKREGKKDKTSLMSPLTWCFDSKKNSKISYYNSMQSRFHKERKKETKKERENENKKQRKKKERKKERK